METLKLEDFLLVNDLMSRRYTKNTFVSNGTRLELEKLLALKRKLKQIATYFSQDYEDSYGPFETDMSTGNPIGRGATLNNVWAGFYKGNYNKQYAAQISFVMNKDEACLDVGFYFGRASARKLAPGKRRQLESQLRTLGVILSDAISMNLEVQAKYNTLFDFGFTAYASGIRVNPDQWHNIIRTQAQNSHLVAKIYPNSFGIIESSTIDAYVSQIIYLMGSISDNRGVAAPITIKPLTPEQRARQALRLAEIGLKGELFAMEYEKNRLTDLGIFGNVYPKHVALESMHYGYDILSQDENGNAQYIEVKTTTRKREDNTSRKFFISTNEFNTFSANRLVYKLYRVYDVENNPSLDILDLGNLDKQVDGYIVQY
jgi:hypothetical protein